MSSPQEKARAERPGSRSFPVVMSVFALLLAAGVALGVFIYGRFVAFERTVARHVPSDAALALRWDVEKVQLFEPTRRYLLPLLDLPERSGPNETAETRRQRLQDESGLDFGRDLREALVLIGPGEDDWSLVLGGSFPKDGLLDAIELVLATEGRSVFSIDANRVHTAAGIAIGRAKDGALVLASNPARLEATLPVRPLDASVPRTGAGSLVLRADAPGLSSDMRSVLAELGDVSRVEGRAEWGSPVVVELDVHYRGRPPPDALARGRRVVAELIGPGAVPPTEIVTRVTDSSPCVTFRIQLNDEALERAARRSADSVYGTLWQRRRKYTAP